MLYPLLICKVESKPLCDVVGCCSLGHERMLVHTSKLGMVSEFSCQFLLPSFSSPLQSGGSQQDMLLCTCKVFLVELSLVVHCDCIDLHAFPACDGQSSWLSWPRQQFPVGSEEYSYSPEALPSTAYGQQTMLHMPASPINLPQSCRLTSRTKTF
ncbi:hypothetical protein T440DRAFT_130368 [Plenodomus tracheiphilus IPT5]|uniref:Uncharacterized protein n=1 Tax=Plenodomus tracheiphilus IPT5 TaxID=1408161 RepID=A0A6A7B4G5_9PLEO|nr:hypothetical protein T440DRAFT_130368 [Plenodomus tracheiphilus IPT5]